MRRGLYVGALASGCLWIAMDLIGIFDPTYFGLRAENPIDVMDRVLAWTHIAGFFSIAAVLKTRK